jgi:superfamily II DNA or RNA helicase
MSERRRFNAGERSALYLAADGRCENCGFDLAPSWHSDHVDPYSRGGATDLINGQALCPQCNLRKGAKTLETPHNRWQRRAIEKFEALGSPKDFLVCATPGAGKTNWALKMARRLLDEGAVGRVAVVAPTDALRTQWADEAAKFGIQLAAVSEATDYDKKGYNGYVATYHQLANKSGADLARRASRTPTLVILDEIHHAGESRSWGDGIIKAFEHAPHRLALTGTPWRNDAKSPIPFVAYDGDGKVIVDFAYEYGTAVADGVCRRIEFHSYGGDATWEDPGRARREAAVLGQLPTSVNFSARVSAEMEEADVSPALDTIYYPSHSWINSILEEAVVMLDDLRTEVPDAAGLVVAERTWMADEYAKTIYKLTGVLPPVVVSDEDDPRRAKEARDTIDRFKKGRDRWIVAVRMISEGVDIPRLAVGVYASKTQTPLFFRQVVGRFVRVRPNEQFNSLLFMPAIPSLIQHANEVEEELRHQLDIETEQDEREARERNTERDPFEGRRPLHASEAEFDRAILGGQESDRDEMAEARAEALRLGIPAQWALNLVPLLRRASQPSAADDDGAAQTAVSAPPSRQRRERMLRSEVDSLAGKAASKLLRNGECGSLGQAKKRVNGVLAGKFGTRKKASVEELETIRDFLIEYVGRP